MKKFLLLFFLISALVFNCSDSSDGGGDDDDDDNEIPPVIGDTSAAYMDITQNKIFNVSHTMQYSLNNQATWSNCSSSVENVVFAVGNIVYVRQISDPTDISYLGTVQALSGSDLIPGKCVIGFTDGSAWLDYFSGYPGQTEITSGYNISVRTNFNNIGDTNCYSADNHIKFYISTDRIITSSDTLLLDSTFPYTCPSGTEYFYPGDPDDDFTVPILTPGVYYVGCIIDSEGVIPEMNEDNNVTLPGDTAEFTIGDTTSLPDGALKVVNSWGKGGWENVPDGHYWITYDTAIALNMWVRYYYNNFSSVYEPTVVAEFNIYHSYRDECLIKIGLGTPSDPFMEKEISTRYSSTYLNGHEPFPTNDIVVDISEFAQYLNDYNVYLYVKNLGTSSGSINSFSVELYSNYNSSPFKTITGTTSSISSTLNSETVVYTSTAGNLTFTDIELIQPNDRADIYGTRFIEEKPSQKELQMDMERVGIYDQGTNYNIIVNGHGTGDQPPTAEQWSNMVKLRSISAYNDRATLPNSVDNSNTVYFPPIGNQGGEGSCTCFSFGYYIQTYTEAKEHNWDLSGTTWLSTDPWGYSDSGRPNSNLDRIFSPDFIYHQINSGVDGGSNGLMAASLIIRLGGASWQKMPYNTSDHSSWPSEEAWRESGRYRGREVGNHYWDYRPCGYFIIYNESDIDLLKSLIAAGYCVSTSIKADAGGLYDYFSTKDVAIYSGSPMSTNHANTIVGYKEGSAWDPLNPEN